MHPHRSSHSDPGSGSRVATETRDSGCGDRACDGETDPGTVLASRT
ncbi:MAG: hypothetical protein MZV64_49120 [Ignavibacteriales bacterium]|nr:hypothetical protein [Ignavibacteriales bacterium]